MALKSIISLCWLFWDHILRIFFIIYTFNFIYIPTKNLLQYVAEIYLKIFSLDIFILTLSFVPVG